jgi:plasmid stabilization system protein ParE
MRRFGGESAIHAMARSLRYHPLFEFDVLSAAEWYDNRQSTLGADFLVRVHRAIEQLTADPERRTPVDYGVRYWPVERFPHVVFYDLTRAEVLILGVMHTSQESKKWLTLRR